MFVLFNCRFFFSSVISHQSSASPYTQRVVVSSPSSHYVIEMVRKEFENHKLLTVQRGLLHDYLGMTIDLSVKGKVMITIFDFMS